MFKKFGKTPWESEAPSTSATDLANRPAHPLTSDLMSALESRPLESTIAQGVAITGTLSFDTLLRIDGSFEGELLSSGKLIIGPTGVVKADLHLEEALISGRVEGNITVTKRLSLCGQASIQGAIKTPKLSVDEGVHIEGNVTVAPLDEQLSNAEDDLEHYQTDH